MKIVVNNCVESVFQMDCEEWCLEELILNQSEVDESYELQLKKPNSSLNLLNSDYTFDVPIYNGKVTKKKKIMDFKIGAEFITNKSLEEEDSITHRKKSHSISSKTNNSKSISIIKTPKCSNQYKKSMELSKNSSRGLFNLKGIKRKISDLSDISSIFNCLQYNNNRTAEKNDKQSNDSIIYNKRKLSKKDIQNLKQIKISNKSNNLPEKLFSEQGTNQNTLNSSTNKLLNITGNKLSFDNSKRMSQRGSDRKKSKIFNNIYAGFKNESSFGEINKNIKFGREEEDSENEYG